MLKRFEHEAKALAKFAHPNIVRIHDFGEHEGAPYLVMEYLEGGCLQDKTGPPMPLKQAVRLLIPIAHALEYAQKRGVIHRDVKPANILLNENNESHLSDFGVAKILEVAPSTILTGTGVGVGTPDYMAPEQWMGKAAPQTDRYALGGGLIRVGDWQAALYRRYPGGSVAKASDRTSAATQGFHT